MRGLGITKAAYTSFEASSKTACNAQPGMVWVPDPNDVTGSNIGTCAPAHDVNATGFDPNSLFANWTSAGPASPAAVAQAQIVAPAPAPAATWQRAPVPPAPLPPSVINGPVPDITASWPQAAAQPQMCDGNGFTAWVDENPVLAALGLVALFALAGGLK